MNPQRKSYLFVGLYSLLIICFSLYSYAFVDLNLTLSSNSYYLLLQKNLTQLGFYHRSASFFLFMVLLGSLFALYLLALKSSKISKKTLVTIICICCGLSLAYPAFSYDIFNYMFDARVVTEYGLSPYFFKALDFPGDTWIRFMRWTHRYYPYGPIWLFITLIPSWIGMSKFVFTLALYKLLFTCAYLLNCYLINKLANTKKINKLDPLIFFALNPLVLIESLLSPHNESLMLLFTLLALQWLSSNKILSYFFLLISIGIKFLSVFLLPFLFIKTSMLKNYTFIYILWSVGLLFVITQREAYSWYFLPLVAFAALSTSRPIKLVTLAGSLALLLRYVPFIRFGEYNIFQQNVWLIGGFIITFFLLFYLSKKGQLFHNYE